MNDAARHAPIRRRRRSEGRRARLHAEDPAGSRRRTQPPRPPPTTTPARARRRFPRLPERPRLKAAGAADGGRRRRGDSCVGEVQIGPDPGRLGLDLDHGDVLGDHHPRGVLDLEPGFGAFCVSDRGVFPQVGLPQVPQLVRGHHVRECRCSGRLWLAPVTCLVAPVVFRSSLRCRSRPGRDDVALGRIACTLHPRAGTTP